MDSHRCQARNSNLGKGGKMKNINQGHSRWTYHCIDDGVREEKEADPPLAEKLFLYL